MFSYHIKIKNKDKFKKLHKDYIKAEFKFCQRISDILLRNIRSIIKSYLRFTKLHGWNYNYTGQLASSFHNSIQKTEFGYRIKSSSNAPQARLLEVGGDVRPKVRQYLKIPLPNTPIPFNQIPNKSLKLKGNILFYHDIPAFVLKAIAKHPPYFYLARSLTKTKLDIKEAFLVEIKKVRG